MMKPIAATVLSVAGLVLAGTALQAQTGQAPASPAETDPAMLQWMVGSPPPPDKQIRFADGSFYQFPRTRWSFAHMRELAPTARISRGAGAPSQMVTALRADIDAVTFTPLGRTDRMTWAQAFEAVYGDAVVILHRGEIVYERYTGVMDQDRPHLAFSVTKSYFGTLAEILIAEGALDENAQVSRYIPELAGSGFGDATVRQVLDMTTALDFSEEYTDPNAGIAAFSFASGLMPAPPGYTGPRGSYAYLPSVAKMGTHGEAFTYRSVNTEVLGWLIARAAGKPAQQVLSDRIWSRLGAEHDADILVDAAGAGMAFGGLNLTARDMARFGEMMRQGGRYNGQQIVPAAVVARIGEGGRTSDFDQAGYKLLPGWSYRSQWWVSHNAHGAYSARGVHGQTIWIDPKAEMVIARFASNPKAGNANFDAISLPAYQAVAEHLMRSQ